MLSISMITSSFIYGKQFYFISIFILSEIRKLYFHFRGRKRFFFFRRRKRLSWAFYTFIIFVRSRDLGTSDNSRLAARVDFVAYASRWSNKLQK